VAKRAYKLGLGLGPTGKLTKTVRAPPLDLCIKAMELILVTFDAAATSMDQL
jgi:hypothetical protein